MIIPLNIRTRSHLFLISFLGRTNETKVFRLCHETKVQNESNHNQELLLGHDIRGGEEGEGANALDLDTDFLTKCKGSFDGFGLASPMLGDVHDGPEHVGEGDDEIGHGDVSHHGICLEHVEW